MTCGSLEEDEQVEALHFDCDGAGFVVRHRLHVAAAVPWHAARDGARLVSKVRPTRHPMSRSQLSKWRSTVGLATGIAHAGAVESHKTRNKRGSYTAAERKQDATSW